MLTIAETEIFSATWPKYWTPEEFGDFCAWLALNPESRRCDSSIRRLSQGPLSGRRTRQTWWCAHHLLQPSCIRNGMVDDDVREERSRGYRRKDVGETPGDARW